MKVHHLFDPETHTLTYVVYNESSSDAIIIDPVWNFDQASGGLHKRSFLELINFLEKHSLQPLYCLETHAHADHVTSAQLLKSHFPKIKIAISRKISQVQQTFAKVFDLAEGLFDDGGGFDILWQDFEEGDLAGFRIRVIPTPGHTPACVSYLIDDCLFVGDCIFMPDSGTGRCDFPGGSAAQLYDSIFERLYTLNEQTKVYVGHDYLNGGRELRYVTTISDQKQKNTFLNESSTRDDFIKRRTERDKTLSAPKLLLPSLQINILAGQLPAASANGKHYLKIPLSLEP